MMGKILIAVFVVLAVALVGFAYYAGLLYGLNDLIPQNPDFSCKADSDCRLIVYPDWTKCRVCNSCKTSYAEDKNVISVNANWKTFCPFPSKRDVQCSDCLSTILPGGNVKARCIDSKCSKVVLDMPL